MNLKIALAGGVMLAALSMPAFADNKVCDFSMGGTSTASMSTPGATSTNAAGLTQNRNRNETSANAGINNNGMATANGTNANVNNSGNVPASETSANASNGVAGGDYAYNDTGHPRWTAEFNGAGPELGSIEASIVKDCNTGDIMYLQLPATNASQTAARAAADLCNFEKQVWVNTDHEGGYLLCQFQGRRKLATAENK